MSNRLRLVIVTTLFVVVGLGVTATPALSPGGPDAAVETTPDAATNESHSNATGQQQAVTVESLVDPCAAESPAEFADPDNESALGWVDGVWYDEPLSFNTSGGVTQSELERLSARTLARVEAIRCLDAEGVPEVSVQTRAEFREDRTSRPTTDDRRQFENGRLETMLLVSQQQDAVSEQGETEGAAVAAFYSPATDQITLLTNETESIEIDEAILAHELGHALQYDQFDFAGFDGQTGDAQRGELALLEGDVTFVEQQYRRGCLAGAWGQPCLGPSSGGNGSAGESVDPEEGELPAGPPNWGLYFIEFQPYSDGPAFVEALYEEGGWAAVNDRYDNPPESALPVARPGVANVSLGDVAAPDRSDDGWERLSRPGQPNYDTVGVAGVSAMFLTPSFESGFETNIYPRRSVLNTGPNGQVDASNPVEYWHPETEGWRDDKLYVYESAGGERATVWRLAWESGADGQEFVDAYTELVAYRGGEAVADAPGTYSFGPDSAFDMAVSIRQDGDTVTVVTAPTVDQLQAVHPDRS